VGDFRKLEVWRRSRALAGSIYRITTTFPHRERYGITAQLRRAVVSVAANLAEGCGRMGDRELRRFVRISLGSLSELECELLLAEDLGYVETTACATLNAEMGEIRRMLQSLHDSLSDKHQCGVPTRL
jgi:four helix bundle protein